MKKEKNGFTLIEIIGAIIILGIIAIIAFATYTNSLKEFREDYYTREAKTATKAAEDFFNDNRNYRPTKILNAQEVSLSTLETRNYIDKITDYNGDSCSDESYVMVVKEGADKYSYHACLICSKDGYDNTAEDIYCDKTWLDPTKVEYGIGETPIAYIYKGSTREELKNELELPVSYVRKNNSGKVIAERRGTKEGNVTLIPVDLDKVNTNVLGTYKVTYTYGTEEKTRDVIVYENKAPTVMYKQEKTVATNLSGTTSTTREDYTSGNWAQNIIVILNSKAFEDSSLRTSKFQWNIDGRWEDFCETDPCEKKITREMNQTVQFRLVDTKGHVSLLTEGATFRIDNTKPRCTLKIPTAKGENNWYKSDVVVEFNEKVDQKPGTDSSVVSGIQNYNIQKSTESLTRVATLNSITYNQDTSDITYNGYVEDKAGNFATCEISFKRDATAPGCTLSDSTSWTKDDRTISWGCSDSGSLCNPSFSGGSQKYTATTPTAEIAAYIVKDNAGNQTTCPSKTANVYVDKTPPTCSISGASTTWISGNRTITWGCSDEHSKCSAGNSGSSTEYKSSTKTATIATYTIKDNAGNQTTCTERSVNVYVDKSNPTCTVAKSNTGTTDGVTTTVTCSDTYGECDSNNSDKGATGLTNGTYTYKVHDKLGHEGSCSTTVTKQRQQRTRSCTAGNTCTNKGCGTERYTYTGTCKGTLYCYYPNPGGAESCGHTSVPSGYTSSGSYQGEYSCQKTGTRNKTCSTISVCGCKTWSSKWTSWTDVSSCSSGISEDNSTDTSCRSVYN